MQFLSAAEATRQARGLYVPAFVRQWLDRTVADARADLDDKTFAAAWEKGRAVTCEEAFGRVLKELGTDPALE